MPLSTRLPARRIARTPKTFEDSTRWRSRLGGNQAAALPQERDEWSHGAAQADVLHAHLATIGASAEVRRDAEPVEHAVEFRRWSREHVGLDALPEESAEQLERPAFGASPGRGPESLHEPADLQDEPDGLARVPAQVLREQIAFAIAREEDGESQRCEALAPLHQRGDV